MDREELIDRVNEATSGNRHDYLTRGDVAQIVDATLSVLGSDVNVPDPQGGRDEEGDDAMGTEDDLGKV
jgi:hypothetical protein